MVMSNTASNSYLLVLMFQKIHFLIEITYIEAGVRLVHLYRKVFVVGTNVLCQQVDGFG